MTPATLAFESPAWLLATAPVAAVAWLYARKASGTSSSWTHGLRAAALACVALALARPLWIGTRPDPHVVILRDVSASMPERAAAEAAAWVTEAVDSAPRNARLQDLVFARSMAPASAADPAPPADVAFRSDTDLDAALRTAAALIPPGHPGRVILFSDGHGRNATTARTIDTLVNRAIAVDVVPPPPSTRPEVALAGVTAPTSPLPEQPLAVDATIQSNTDTDASLSLYKDGLLISSNPLTLTHGTTSLRLDAGKMTDTTHTLSVELTAPNDTRPENNSAELTLRATGGARFLLLTEDPAMAAPLAATLEEAGLEGGVSTPENLRLTRQSLAVQDLVIIENLPSPMLDTNTLRTLDDWIRNSGGGLIVIGGDSSFGSGGYAGSPLARLLPVRVEHDDRQESPSVALMVALDRSGSMAARTATGDTKIALAAEGVARAAGVLKPGDLFGTLAVDTAAETVVPLSPVHGARSTDSLRRKLAGIASSGGGIYTHTAIETAARALRGAPAAVRHVILFADAADAEEKARPLGGLPGSPSVSTLDLAASLSGDGITLSVVALGGESDKDTAFLKALAARGGGRFHLTADPLSLPTLFTTETRLVKQGSLVEEPFRARPLIPSPVIEGIDWADSPFLLGYNMSKPRTGAPVVLATEFGDPLLAVWHVGLGKVAAFLSDAGPRWASEWLGWPGYKAFWRQLARSALRAGPPNPTSIETRRGDRTWEVHVRTTSPGGAFRDGVPMRLRVTDDQGTTTERAASQVGPGHYRAVLPESFGRPTGIAAFEVGDAGRPATLDHPEAVPPESATSGVNTPWIESLASRTGGRIDPAPADAFRPAAMPGKSVRPLRTPLLLLAAALVLAEVAMRRLPAITGGSPATR